MLFASLQKPVITNISTLGQCTHLKLGEQSKVLYLSSIISHFLDFIQCYGFGFYFLLHDNPHTHTMATCTFSELASLDTHLWALSQHEWVWFISGHFKAWFTNKGGRKHQLFLTLMSDCSVNYLHFKNQKAYSRFSCDIIIFQNNISFSGFSFIR